MRNNYSDISAAMAAKKKTKLFADVGQQHHIGALPPTGRTRAPGAVASRTDVHDLAQAVHRDIVSVSFNEGRPHLLLCAKNTVAFFNTSFASRSIRLSFRSSESSHSRSD